MMKLNKWTMGLATVGLVSMPAIGSAEEQMNQVWTALSSTTISGYVNTSMHWNPGTGNSVVPGYAFNTPDKQDGFNLNVVKLSLEKPLDEAQWAAGYKVDLLFGEDAALLGTANSIGRTGNLAEDTQIKQAYVNLRTPVGNGLDFKVGVWDTIIGYEVFDSGSNPNYTRSYGYSIEPTTHTGVLGSYQLNKSATFSFGIANTFGPVINQKANPPKAESYKTYMAAVALTAPDDWGFLAGSTAYGGFINGFNNGATWDQTSLYTGFTMNTPIKGWRVGASYDYMGTTSEFDAGSKYANALAIYSSVSLSEKLSFHARGEYAWTDAALLGTGDNATFGGGNSEVFALTGTLQYDLWKNVISRLEIRWDHQAGDGDMDGYGGDFDTTLPLPVPPDPAGNNGERNSVLVAVNLIYVF
ncbi:MAG TPA: outer membrane beta-barrel protein [Verrucomicrobiae bacterium]|nr:outer membrane beta-barrel protein [Verrucomicrobiae bacterium]